MTGQDQPHPRAADALPRQLTVQPRVRVVRTQLLVLIGLNLARRASPLRNAFFLTLAFGAAAFAQIANPAIKFEVASVKPAAPSSFPGMSGGPGTPDPGQFHAFGVSLWNLFLVAYHISQYQVVTPEWLKSARFDVAAKVPGGATKQEFNIMLQNLLVERFKLTLRRERKELPAYNLVIAKGGPKLRRVADGPQSKDYSAAPGASYPAKYTTGKDGYPVLQLEPGATSGIAMGNNGRLTDWMGKLTMAQFAARLSSNTGRPVFDRTGLSGSYDITLRFRWDVSAGANDVGEPQDKIAAMQSQLGLRLEMTKAMLEVLVVSHIERVPVAN